MTQVMHDRRRWVGLLGVVVGLTMMHGIAAQGPAQGQTGSDGGLAKMPASDDGRGAAARGESAGTERLIPFQAYLTDTAGRPIQGQRCLKFQIYDGPTGDSQPFVWDESHDGVAVDKGMVNVLLGSRTPFPETATFDAAHYVGVSVGESCAELMALEPRQQIVSAVHAVDTDRAKDADHAENANRLGGSPGGFLANSVEIVPIGTITPWFGNPATLPSTWTLCDGRTVNDPESPLNGIAVPDMRASFPRGETDTNRDIPGQGPGSGGSDTDSWYVPDHSHGISVSSAGEHQHAITAAGDHQHETTVVGQGSNTGSLFVDDEAPFGLGGLRETDTWGFSVAGHSTSCRFHLTNNAGNHSHSCVSAGAHSHSAGSSGAGAASGTINTIPRYVALHYIIRIK